MPQARHTKKLSDSPLETYLVPKPALQEDEDPRGERYLR